MAQSVVRGDAPWRSPIELVVTVAADVLHGSVGGRVVSAETRDVPAAVCAVNAVVAAEPREVPVTVNAVASVVSAEAGEGTVADFADSTHISSLLHAPLAVFADGTCVSAETARRLACDCGIVHVTEDASGAPLTVGRKTRSIPVAIARALLKRDSCCRFPGCGNRVYVEGHHVKHWADGGETALDNLVTMCGFHHRFVHEYDYSVVLDAEQHPRFFDPRGSEVLDVPERPTPERLGWPTVVARNATLAIDATTNECLWDGDEPDYVDIIDALVRVDGLQ